MVFQDIIDIAKYGELNNLAIKSNTEAIIAFINMGIYELYKRFPLKVDEYVVTLEENVTMYDLPEDFMYPIEAFGEVNINNKKEGPDLLSINDTDNPQSIIFPNFTQVQIPLDLEDAYITIKYVVKPERIGTYDLQSDITIPESLVEALVYYIAYRAHSGVKTEPQSENNIHYIRFDSSCKKARELGVAYPLTSWAMVSRITDRGFV